MRSSSGICIPSGRAFSNCCNRMLDIFSNLKNYSL
nr:MAG TPA: hypothetical protein [Caudoviricetes sp.]